MGGVSTGKYKSKFTDPSQGLPPDRRRRFERPWAPRSRGEFDLGFSLLGAGSEVLAWLSLGIL